MKRAIWINKWYTPVRHDSTTTGLHMAKPNYSFAKYQRELAKKKKKEEKRRQKSEAQQKQTQEDFSQSPVDETPAD